MLAAFGVVVAGKADRGLADTLDQIKNGVAFLFADGVAQNAAEQADIVSQRFVFGGIERVQ